MSVAIGSIALGMAWRRRMLRSGMPLARAVVMYSSPSVSTIDERITIAYWPINPSATVASGSARCDRKSASWSVKPL